MSVKYISNNKFVVISEVDGRELGTYRTIGAAMKQDDALHYNPEPVKKAKKASKKKVEEEVLVEVTEEEE